MNAPNAEIVLNNGMLVRQRPSVRKQQLKCFSFLRKFLHSFATDPVVAVKQWNNIPSDVRNRPDTLMIAVRASSAFHPAGRCGIDFNAAIQRATLLNLASNTHITDSASPSLLSWISRYATYIHCEQRYSPMAVIMAMCSRSWEHKYIKQTQKWGIVEGDNSSGAEQQQALETPAGQFCSKRWQDVINIAAWIVRRSEHRARDTAERLHAMQAVDFGLSLQDRVQVAQERIQAVRPLHWSTHLSSFHKVIASRLRPDGKCLGIELEFLASKGSNICTWDEDDYPEVKWHHFHTDGSIQSDGVTEALPRYQEYTCFINGDNPRDWDNVRKVLSEITTSGAIINASCGNHVHIDMRQKSQASYYRVAGKVRGAIETWAHRLVSCKRAYNHYCSIQGSHHSNRYTAVNTQSWPEHRTLEVRLGMPTLNYTKLQHWSQFLQYLASDRAETDTLDEFMDGGAPLHLKMYALRRIRKFRETYVRNSHADLPNYDKYITALNAIEGYNANDTDGN